MVNHHIGKLFRQVFRSIVGSLFFLIYINDLTDNLSSNVKLFADDTSLFSQTCDPLETANVLNNYLTKICK